MKNALAIALVAAAVVACATPPETQTAAAPKTPLTKPACAPPPQSLVVTDIAPGDGDAVQFRTAVLVQYTGWLYDGCAADLKGEQFDSSVGRATPFGLIVGAGRVIKGWDEGLIGMKEKGKRLLVIPPDKGYGAQGAGGGKIPPNATLVFEVEVVKILAPGGGAGAKPQ